MTGGEFRQIISSFVRHKRTTKDHSNVVVLAMLKFWLFSGFSFPLSPRRSHLRFVIVTMWNLIFMFRRFLGVPQALGRFRMIRRSRAAFLCSPGRDWAIYIWIFPNILCFPGMCNVKKNLFYYLFFYSDFALLHTRVIKKNQQKRQWGYFHPHLPFCYIYLFFLLCCVFIPWGCVVNCQGSLSDRICHEWFPVNFSLECCLGSVLPFLRRTHPQGSSPAAPWGSLPPPQLKRQKNNIFPAFLWTDIRMPILKVWKHAANEFWNATFIGTSASDEADFVIISLISGGTSAHSCPLFHFGCHFFAASHASSYLSSSQKKISIDFKITHKKRWCKGEVL